MLFFDSLERVETAWELFEANDSTIKQFNSKWRKLKDELIYSYGHSMSAPGDEARFKSSAVNHKIVKLYSKIKETILS